MKVAYLCHRVPYPPDKGDKIRAYHQIEALARHHEVDLFTLADDPADLGARDALLKVCRNVTIARVRPRLAKLASLLYLPSRTPLTLPFFRSRVLADAVNAALRTHGYDRIVVYCSAMGQYVDQAGNIPVISDLVDVDSDKWAQYADSSMFPMKAVYRREASCLREYERKLCLRSAAVVVSTDREAAVLREFAGAANIHVLTNGVNADFFRPSPPQPAEPPAVVFTGDMSYFPNEQAVVFFTRDVLPLIRESVPGTRFIIVGRNPGPRVRELARTEGIEVTGFVPDVRTYLARARVSVAPFLIAAGIQNKILEAMASGLPVVATPRTVQGLSAGVAEVVNLGQSAPELARAVAMLLRDETTARRQGAEGRSRVIEAYNWDRSGEGLLRMLEKPTSRAAAALNGAAH